MTKKSFAHHVFYYNVERLSGLTLASDTPFPAAFEAPKPSIWINRWDVFTNTPHKHFDSPTLAELATAIDESKDNLLGYTGTFEDEFGLLELKPQHAHCFTHICADCETLTISITPRLQGDVIDYAFFGHKHAGQKPLFISYRKLAQLGH